MRISKILPILAIVYYLPVALLPSSLIFGREEKKLHLAVTSDMHSWYSNTLLYPKRTPAGLAHLAPIIRTERKKYPDLILLDGGDLLQGSPLAYYYNLVHQGPAKENPFFRLFVQLKYDAVTIGNHDFEILNVIQNKYLPTSPIRWLGANVTEKGKNILLPYILLSRQGLRVAVLGLTTPAVPMWVNPSLIKNLTFQPIIPSAKKWIAHIQKKERPDLIIGLIHSGDDPLRDDKNTKLRGVPAANTINQLLSAVPDFDLVLFGHNHRWPQFKSDLSVPYLKGTPIVSLGKKGERLIRLQMTLLKSEGEWKIHKLHGSILRPIAYKERQRNILKTLPPSYLQFLYENTPWKLEKQASKKELSICINEIQARALDEPNLDGTLLPLVRIKTKGIKRGDLLQRAHLFHWNAYDNKAISVMLSRREIDLLSKPFHNRQDRKTIYNQLLYPWIKSEEIYSPLAYDYWWPKHEEWQRKFRFKISDYHYNGGGGVFSALFYPRIQVAEEKKEAIREKLFRMLSDPEFLMPETCSFFRRIQIQTESPP